MQLENKSHSIFLNSIPVGIGYIFLGLTFGILFVKNGGDILSSFLISLTTFAGAAQFIFLSLMKEGIDIYVLFLFIFLINFRHFFYGISSLSFLGEFNLKKVYLISALTDENFGMLQNLSGKQPQKQGFLVKVFSLNHVYWVSGCTIGALLGKNFQLNIKGLDFSLTALFIVLSLEGIKNISSKKRRIK